MAIIYLRERYYRERLRVGWNTDRSPRLRRLTTRGRFVAARVPPRETINRNVALQRAIKVYFFSVRLGRSLLKARSSWITGYNPRRKQKWNSRLMSEVRGNEFANYSARERGGETEQTVSIVSGRWARAHPDGGCRCRGGGADASS